MMGIRCPNQGGDKVTKSREEKRNNITKLFRSPPPLPI